MAFVDPLEIIGPRATVEGALAEAEADLARAVENLARARAVVVKAEKDLAASQVKLPRVVSSLVKARIAVTEEQANVAAARSRCCVISATLTKLNHQEGRPIGFRMDLGVAMRNDGPRGASEERRKSGHDRRKVRRSIIGSAIDRRVIRGNRRQAHEAPSLTSGILDNRDTGQPMDRCIAGTTSAKGVPSEENRPPMVLDSSQGATLTGAQGWRVLAYQSVELVSLILAYLQYYLIDASLQVSRLPSVGVIFLS